jgi:hypothetical protein
MKTLARLPLYPLLLAAYAVLFVYAANIGEVLPRELVQPLLVALAAAAAVLMLCALLFRDLRRGALLASALVLAFAFFGHLGSIVDGETLTEAMQLLLCAVFIIAVGVYAARARGSLPGVTSALNIFGIVLVAIALVSIIPTEADRVARASRGEPAGDQVVAEASRLPERDIYYLVFDRYGSDWSINEFFDFQNDIYPELTERGFQVIPGARANYRATDFSLASTLNMATLDDLTESVGRASDDRTPAREKLQHHEVGRFLRANGYRYYHLGAWYGPTRTNAIADEVLVWGQTTEFEQIVRDATVLPALERLVGTGEEDDFRNRHREEALFELRQLGRLAETPGRKFVFAHVLLPHPPYGFDAEGDIVVKATEKEAMAEGRERDLYADQLDFTNARMLELVDVLLDRPAEEQPIIVISGDEGPFICGNTDCVDRTPESYGIRFGTLRAYYLPGLDYEVPSDDTGVNIFRMLFREYFGADLPDLPNRSYDWPDNDHLYDFRDITDELPLPGGEAEETASD